MVSVVPPKRLQSSGPVAPTRASILARRLSGGGGIVRPGVTRSGPPLRQPGPPIGFIPRPGFVNAVHRPGFVNAAHRPGFVSAGPRPGFANGSRPGFARGGAAGAVNLRNRLQFKPRPASLPPYQQPYRRLGAPPRVAYGSANPRVVGGAVGKRPGKPFVKARVATAPVKKSLDMDLDEYMSKSKHHLDLDLSSYMKKSKTNLDADLDTYMTQSTQ